MRAITGWTALVLLIGIGGCGGGNGHPAGPRTFTLENNTPLAVPAGYCDSVSGPVTVGAGSMAFTIVDTPTGIGSDSMEVGIMHSADFDASGGCNFNLAIVDDVGTGSISDASPAGGVAASTYDFIVGCNNIVDDCLFNLTWTATY
jgi:hypothetical protein